MPPYVPQQPDYLQIEFRIKDQAEVFNVGAQCEPCSQMLGREKVGILYLLLKSIVSVLKELIYSPKSLHQSSAIDSAKFNLFDSVRGQIPGAAKAMSLA